MIAAIVAFQPGCMLTRAIGHNAKEDARVIHVDQAFVDGNDLIVDYVIAPISKADSSSSRARLCGTFFLNWNRFLETNLIDVKQIDAGQPNVSALSNAMGKDGKVLDLGQVYSRQCSRPFLSQRHIPQEKKVSVVNASQHLGRNDYPARFVYFNKDFVNEFYYVDRSTGDNSIKVVKLSAGEHEYMPWYGPILFVSLPLAIAADVVTFPIQLIICGMYGENCPVDP